MKHSIILWILFIITLNTTSTYTEPPFTHIKGLHQITVPEYPHLSIINGFVWWNKKIIENMYRFGDKNHSTIKLLWNLFHLQHDEVTFDITNIEKNPAKYFSIQTIGKILATVEKYSYQKTLSEEDKQNLFNQLFKTIANDINIEEITKNSKAKVEKIKIKAKEAFPNYQKYFEIIANINAINENKTLLSQAGTKSEKTTLYSKITELKNKNKKIGSKSKLSKDPNVKSVLKKIHAATITKKSLRNTVNLLIEAFDENLHKIYTPFSFHHILLAFVWQKANSRKDLIPFFEQLKLSHPKIINKAALEALTTEQTPSQYTQKDADEFNKSIHDQKITRNFIAENYEKIVFSLYSYDFFTNPLPQMIDSLSGVKYKDKNGNEYHFPDCGSTSLRNFINIITYNWKSKKIEVSKLIQLSKIDHRSEKKLKNIPLIISPQIINYYNVETHKDLKYVHDRPAHSAWAQVTSELSNVKYLTPENNGVCEVGLGIANMLNIINHLFFNNSPAFDQLKNSEKLDLLTSRVSNNDFKLTWKSDTDVNDIKYNTDNIINFSIELKKSSSILNFDWHFEPKHFFIKTKELDTIENKLKELFHLPVLDEQEQEEEEEDNDLQFSQQIPNTNIMVMSSTINNSKLVSPAPPSYSLLYFCSLSKQERKNLIEADKILPQIENVYTYKGYLNFLAKQFGNLSFSTKEKLLKHIIENKIVKYYNLALSYPSRWIPDLHETLFTNILQNKMIKYYEYIRKFLDGPYLKKIQIKIVKNIISNNISTLSHNATEYISNKLKELTTPQKIIVELLEIIISNEISSLYSLTKKKISNLNDKNQRKIKNLIDKYEIKKLSDIEISRENISENISTRDSRNLGTFISSPFQRRRTTRIRRSGLGQQSRRVIRRPLIQRPTQVNGQ